MPTFFRFDGVDIDLDDLTLGESEEIDAIVNAGKGPNDKLETWAVARPTSSPLHLKAIARVCFARVDTSNADERAANLSLKDAIGAIVVESDPLGATTDGGQS